MTSQPRSSLNSRPRQGTMPGILTDDQNEFVETLGKKINTISSHIEPCTEVIEETHETSKIVRQEIEDQYSKFSKQLEQNKARMLNKVQQIETKKIATINENVQDLQSQSKLIEFKNTIESIIKDRMMNIQKKQQEISKIIQTIKNSDCFSDELHNFNLDVTPKLGYTCDADVFTNCLLAMDEVMDFDCLRLKQVSFRKNENNQLIDLLWACQHRNAAQLRFALEMRESANNENDNKEDLNEEWLYVSPLTMNIFDTEVMVGYDARQIIKPAFWYDMRIAMVKHAESEAANTFSTERTERDDNKKVLLYSNIMVIQAGKDSGPLIDSAILTDKEKKYLFKYIPKYPVSLKSRKAKKQRSQYQMRLELLYRASRDGFRSRVFHKMCDTFSKRPVSPATPRTDAKNMDCKTPQSPGTGIASFSYDLIKNSLSINTNTDTTDDNSRDMHLCMSTICVIQATGTDNVFGGFTSQDWGSGGGYKRDSHAFLFLLRKKQTKKKKGRIRSQTTGNLARQSQTLDLVVPQKWKIRKKQFAIYCSNKFGGGCDFCISDNCNENEESYSDLCHKNSSFAMPASNSLLAGSEYFGVKEIEVYRVIYYK